MTKSASKAAENIVRPGKGSSVAVVTGTGTDSLFVKKKMRTISTNYGDAVVFEAIAGDRQFYVLPRHGPSLSIPPHRINFRANISALASMGVGSIVATSAVGSLNRRFSVGSLGLVSQFLDFTKARPSTFFDERAVHTDMTAPYDKRLNDLIRSVARRFRIGLTTDLVYVCAEGPRYESSAEITMYRVLGGDVVGMTGVPEVVLSRELGMRYVSIVVATNWAAGIQEKVSHQEVMSAMTRTGGQLKQLIEESVKSVYLVTKRG
jgi:5'-methylthioadenosine phosphorylase